MKKTAKKGLAMFAKEGGSMADEGKVNSIIGKGCKVKGTIDVQDGTLRIDGDFEGNVNCPGGTLVIGKGGTVKADINVSNAVVGGTVNGNIDAKEKIELQAGSRLEGDIKTRRLVIDEGVFFEGSCKMSPDGKPMVSAPAAQPEVKKEEKEKTGAWNK
jgi:cytoskeletal protein CcmA (bactofilin family)